MRVPTHGLLLVMLAASGCNAAGAESDFTGTLAEDFVVYPSPAVPQEFHIPPSTTSPSTYEPIGATNGKWDPDRDHYVYRPAIGVTTQPPPWRLVLFLPGCGGAPAGYTTIMQVARDQGYHVIGLDYPDPCPGDVCGSDLTCMGSYRHEVLFGDAASDPVWISGHPQDAIIRRLEALLLHLEATDPYGAWSTFIETDASAPNGLRLRWDRIVTAGHSLGAGYAAYIAKYFGVARVAMFTSPGDSVDACTGSSDPACVDPVPPATSPLPTSDDWLTGHVTGASRYFGLIHEDDIHGNNHVNRTLANWAEIGVPVGQQKVSSATCTGTCDPHTKVVKDAATYTTRWQIMLGAP